MLFNSLPYIFAFLPITLIVYFRLNAYLSMRTGQCWLVLASLFFYSYWNPKYLPLILLSISVNYFFGQALIKASKKPILILGLAFNLGLLAYFKYTNFIVNNTNAAFGTHFHVNPIELPLAISFFTFLQIAYLVDCHQQKVKHTNFVDYSLFVTFFPHLIAGPLVHHKDLMPQFSMEDNRFFNWRNFYSGLCVFFIGLFKKVIIADTFSVWAKAGFDAVTPLSFFDAWGCSLSYTLQLYYDFSGYADMAVGASLLFNIKLPWNFNSPYKATNLQDFWHRWHMTLSRWLRDYLYIPLGGNRKGEAFTYLNLLITFLLGGLWHGANWTFVIWGALHGIGTVIHRGWQKLGFRMNPLSGWIITFLYVHVAWVFFRAKTLPDAMRVLHGMTDINSAHFSSAFANAANYFISWPALYFTGSSINLLLPISALLALLACLPYTWLAKNTIEINSQIFENERTNPYFLTVVLVAICTLFQMIYMPSQISEFIYFHF
jgi:D-alanyl-lipoteichoic acid acyltransferase DltB (MBOAT superfamily)